MGTKADIKGLNDDSLAFTLDEAPKIDSYWEMLKPLSMKAKLQLAIMLTNAVYEEEAIKEKADMTKTARRVRRRAERVPSDQQLAARFAGLESPELPEDPEWSQVIAANTGKTIKPIQKWL